MGIAPRKLRVGEVVEIDGRSYDVVPDGEGGATLEPAITVSSDTVLAQHGLTPLTQAEFGELFDAIPTDGEG